MMFIKKLIVRLRMWYADIRGHHGKRWNYEPGDWYMGQHKKKQLQLIVINCNEEQNYRITGHLELVLLGLVMSHRQLIINS